MSARLIYGIADSSHVKLNFFGRVAYTIKLLSSAVVRFGDILEIQTTGIVNHQELICKFGSISVAATQINMTRVQCVVPSFEGNVSLSVSCYPGTWSNSVSILGRFQASVSRLFPTAIPSVGSVYLTLFGREFSDTSVMCTLGLHSSKAHFINNTLAICSWNPYM